ncbi:hypothetical protein [Paenibacillus aceti]|uniref:YopX protein domain-containing protein n=1 Tax=Paenibacillus aceti TaxID=1820010 RepID=A0ABQ1VRE0_9BACL|nr:hypothetical protein [Paenibacillus aceti]GGF86634.1 hypothetical protein GCM10010913_05180 [Paenibacillus aceti]
MIPTKFRGIPKDTNEFIFGSLVKVSKSGSLAISYLDDGGHIKMQEIKKETAGMFTGCEDGHETDNGYSKLWSGDIIELKYEDELITCKIEYSICGFVLVSDSFEDGYVWMSELVESDGAYDWIADSKLIGNIYSQNN